MPPTDDREFAIMFEDDIEVVPAYFDYVLSVLSHHVYDKQGKRIRNYHSDHLIGISLTTPRFDETSIPIRAWTPNATIPFTEPFFQFQLACSWGAVYFPWAWRDYLEYYRWRRPMTLPKKIDTIPFSFVNIWERSWKRYLQELMFATGKSLIYPNFPHQQSFSTHHREIGEHTQGSAKVPDVDAIGTNNRPVFTVPLLTNRTIVNDALANMHDLADLPILDFYHQPVQDIYALAELGLVYADVMREFGFRPERYSTNSRCILDYAVGVPKQLQRSSAAQKQELYVTFHPQGNILEQLEQFRAAIAIAHNTGRTLLVPDFVVDGQRLPLPEVLDEDSLLYDGFIKIRRLTEEYKMADRFVAFRPFDVFGERPRITTLDLFDFDEPVNRRRNISLPLGPGLDHDIYRWFKGCQDQILVFSDLRKAFSQYVFLREQEKFDEFIQDSIVLSSRMQRLVKQEAERLGRVACVVYSRPLQGQLCKRAKYDYKYWRSIHYRNCNATAERLMDYLDSWITSNIDIDTVLMLTDGSLTGTLPLFASHAMGKKGDLVPVVWDQWGMLAGFVDPQQATLRQQAALIIAEELCTEAPFFLGNAFSHRTERIVARRSKAGRLTNILGMGTMAPFRNETLPTLD